MSLYNSCHSGSELNLTRGPPLPPLYKPRGLVSISASTIAVGAFFALDSSGNSFAGKAYVFVRPATGWAGNLNETARLTAPTANC
jgi:hypothetical protein